MNWKNWTISVSALLLIGGNTYLLFKKDSQIHRVAMIEKWTKATEQNLTETKLAAGLVTPVSEEHVYYDEGFTGFLVEEGAAVSPDTPLVALDATNIEAERTKREAEIEQIEEEITAVEDNLDNLDDLLSEAEDAIDPTSEGDSSTDATLKALEVEIYEKELQLSTLEAELTKQETLLESLEENPENLTINASIRGTVKEIRSDLSNPIMTITSDDVQVEAQIAEADVHQLSEGMKVKIISPHVKDPITATIAAIATLPSNTPSLKKEATYKYMVQLNKQAEGLLVGSKVDLKITTDEVKDAVTVPAKAIRQQATDYLTYVLMPNGSVERRVVETGLQVCKTVEISTAIEEDELVVLEGKRLKNGRDFFTALQFKKASVKELGKKDTLKQIAKGALNQ